MIHELDPDKILFAGDWHGVTQSSMLIINQAAQYDVPVIIHAGDFGVWNTSSSQRFLKAVNHVAKENNVHIYFVDGNHEEFPHLYNDFPLEEDGTRRIRSNIHHLPRGFRWNWDGVDFLAMGGAFSVDRQWRKLGESYFDEEMITPEDIEKAGSERTDVLISHDSPTDAPNPVTDDPRRQLQGVRAFGQEAIIYATLHREMLKVLTDKVDPVLIAHGHYHAFQIKEYIRDITGTRCVVLSLDENTAPAHRTARIVSIEQLKELKIQEGRDETA